MAGIVSVGAHVPWYRLTGEVLAPQWGGSTKGGRSVANHDEDTITMAIEAVRRALDGRDPKKLDGLYFASTTMPYTEKGNAIFVATVADMRHDVFAFDMAGSLRAATGAIRAARDAVEGGGAKEVAVVAADIRLASPGDPSERFLGDAAAAVIVAKADTMADIVDIYSTTHEFIDVWRTQKDQYIQAADTKFIMDTGYTRFMGEAATAILARNNVSTGDIAKVAVFSPDGRTIKAIAKSLKVDDKKCVNLLDSVGDSGTANTLLALVAAIENSKSGDLILALSHSSGADAILLRVTDRVKKLNGAKSVEAQIKRSRPLTSYAKYLQFRDVIPKEEIRVWTAPPVLWREEKENYRLLAKRCNKCEAIQYPVRRVCWKCSAKDNMSDVKLANTGKVFTFAKDHLVPNPDSPTVMVSVDIDGGGRFYTQMTDCDPNEIRIGMDVEFTLRRFHEGGGFYNYFWKFRPVCK